MLPEGSLVCSQEPTSMEAVNLWSDNPAGQQWAKRGML